MDDSNLTERYNDGLISAPEMPGEPERLPYPVWRPTAAQVQAARKDLGRNLALLALLVCACLLVLALLLGWRP